MKPRILMVSGNGPPVLDGVAHYTANLMGELARQRPAWDWLWLYRRPRWFHAPVRFGQGIRHYRPGHTWGPLGIRLASGTARWLRPHAIHIQEQVHSFHETAAAARLARTAPGALLATLHEFHGELPSVRHTRAVVGRATVLIANDRHTALRCEQWTGRAADHTWWSPPNVRPPEPSWQVRTRPHLCVSFGFISALKRLNVVRQALEPLRASYPDLRWRIVGPFDPAANAEHAAAARDLAADWIEFTGGIVDSHDSRLRTWLGEGAVMLLPFADGASPRRTTLQTAWAFDLPVVTTPPSVPEPALVHGQNCLLAPLERPAEWGASVSRLFADPAEATRLKAGGRAAADQFSWRRLAALHLEQYERILERAPCARRPAQDT
ncbi:MAG TPA: glycosyltransferase family 4 protein [Gemmataceae bacterium]|nr:glycosyltransferase family 4 protein [Gemmataceae bacterium]